MQARQERSFGGLFLFRYIPSFGATIPLAVFIVSRGESAGYRSGEISAALNIDLANVFAAWTDTISSVHCPSRRSRKKELGGACALLIDKGAVNTRE